MVIHQDLILYFHYLNCFFSFVRVSLLRSFSLSFLTFFSSLTYNFSCRCNIYCLSLNSLFVKMFASILYSLPSRIVLVSATILFALRSVTSLSALIFCSFSSSILSPSPLLKSLTLKPNCLTIFSALDNALSKAAIVPCSASAVISFANCLTTVGAITVFLPADTVFIVSDMIVLNKSLTSDSNTAIIYSFLMYLHIDQTKLRQHQQLLILTHFVL